MAKEMLINVSEGEECRIALLEDGKLEELYMERTSSTSHVGNIYKGRVTNVEPSIQAAFVDFGLGRNGFLHISDLMPSYFGHKGDDYTEAVGRKMSRRDRPPIQRCLRRGDDITVQIIKEGIGTKGPTLTTYLSIPGRILVMMPGMSRFGISRKIEDEEERRRLRGILDGLKPIDEVGFIIRTAGVGKNKTEIERDLKYLTRLWENISKKMKEPAPVELYTEGDLVTRTVRDVYTSDITRIVVDNKDVTKRIKEFFKIAMPRTKNKVELYEEPIPLFHKHRIEEEIEQMYSRHVPLPGGGSLVIDSTEAVVAIDVNSGKFRDHSDAEMTAFKTDMEAADEIPRQLRLRDLGGVIICDFIDLRYDRHRRDLEQRLHDNLRSDRAKTKVLRMSQFGIIEMTRQRMRPSLKRSIYSDCPHCKGSGLVKTPESMSLDVMRKLAMAMHDQRVARIELSVCPDVALYLLNKKRSQLAELEGEMHKRISIRHDDQLSLDEMKMVLFDSREGMVFIEALGMNPHDQTTPIQGRGGAGHAPGGRNDRGRGGRQDNRRGGGGRPDNRQGPDDRNRSRDQHPDDERFEIDNVEDAVDQREKQHAASSASISSPAPVYASAPSVGPEKDGDADDESNVIDVEEGTEPLGEAPQAVEDDRDNGPRGRRRRRGRRGRGGGRDERQGNAASENGPRENSPRENGPRSATPAPPPVASSQRDEVMETPASDQSDEQEMTGDGDSEESDQQGAATEAEGDQPQKKRRRRRGGRRHRRRKEREGGEANGDVAENGQAPQGEKDQAVEDDEDDNIGNRAEPAPNRPQPQRRPPQRRNESARRNESDRRNESVRRNEPAAKAEPPRRSEPPRIVEPPAPVVRTGSTDKHLMTDDDEPLLPEAPRRPRTYRDLDAIPDDLD